MAHTINRIASLAGRMKSGPRIVNRRVAGSSPARGAGSDLVVSLGSKRLGSVMFAGAMPGPQKDSDWILGVSMNKS